MLAFFYATFASFSMAGAQFTPVTPLIARWFMRRRAAALSVLTSGGSAGAMLLLPFAAYLMQLTSWRVALLAIVGMLGILVLPLVVIIIRNRPEQMGLEPDAVLAAPCPGEAPERARWRSRSGFTPTARLPCGN